MESGFHPVVAQNFANAKCILWQDRHNLLQRDDLDVLLDACMLAAREMTLIGHAWLPQRLTRKKINLNHAGMELWNLREIHAERPHGFQRRVDDHFLFGPEWWLQLTPPN